MLMLRAVWNKGILKEKEFKEFFFLILFFIFVKKQGMKPHRAAFLKFIEDNNLADKLNLFFLGHESYEAIKFKVQNGRILVCITERLKQIFVIIESKKEEILQNLGERYKGDWINAFGRVSMKIEYNTPLRLNEVITAIYGPYFYPEREAQSYNVYTRTFFSDEEINILQLSNIEYEKIINGIRFYSFDSVAKSFYNSLNRFAQTAIFNNYDNAIEQNERETQQVGTLIDLDKKSTFFGIKTLLIENFINLDDTVFEFSPNINLFIGRNNTGKTNLLKLLYTVVKSFEEYVKKNQIYASSFNQILSNKVKTVFQDRGENIATIINKFLPNAKFNSILEFSEYQNNKFTNKKNNLSFEFSFGKDTRVEIKDVSIKGLYDIEVWQKYFNGFVFGIFIPVKEVLSINQAINFTSKHYIKGFDATYSDLIDLLMPVKTQIDVEFIADIIKDFEKNVIEGKVEYDDKKNEFFYIDDKNRRYEMTMVAEGIRQLGLIPILLKTGNLNSGTILFLDEPDNQVNPALIKALVEALIKLAENNVQIFVTSHNYFFVNWLYLYSRIKENLYIKYFNFEKDKNNALIKIKDGNLKEGLPDTPIINEAVKIFERDLNLSF